MMRLIEGFRWANVTISTCTGCGEMIDCSQRYITLQLDNRDGSLVPTDCTASYFHTERCLAQALRQAERKTP
jgi:hypothetical protein